MKKVTLILLGVVFSLSIQAQHVFDKGSLMFNAGIGLPYNYYNFIPTFNFTGEYGVIPTGDIGLVSFGGLVEMQINPNSGYANFYMAVGPRAYWHLHVFESDQWDVYAGAGFGMLFRGGGTAGPVGGYGEGFVGGRMMFSEKFGLFAEAGGGARSFMRFGVTFGF
jgi:hypothetical protein